MTWTPGVGRAWNCCLSHVFCKSRFDIVVGVECWCSELAVQLLEHESRRVQTCTLLELLYVMDLVSFIGRFAVNLHMISESNGYMCDAGIVP